MAISIATERTDGTLKSLAGTPMPKSAYFVGKIVQVLVVTLLIIAILLTVGGAAYGVDLPSGSDWITFAWVTVLGSAPARCWASPSRAWRKNGRRPGDGHADRAGAAVHLRCLLPVHQVPAWMQTVASLFPLKWMAQGLRSVFLPDVLARQEAAGLLGARPGGSRPGPLGRGRAGALCPHLPLAGPRSRLILTATRSAPRPWPGRPPASGCPAPGRGTGGRRRTARRGTTCGVPLPGRRSGRAPTPTGRAHRSP